MDASQGGALPSLTAAALALHADRPLDAAAMLTQEAPQCLSEAGADDLGSLMRSAEHVWLGHLDDVHGWLQWQVLCEPYLRRLDLWEGEQDRLVVQLALHAGQPAPLHLLPLVQQVRAHGNVVLAHTRGRRFDAVRHVLDAARALALLAPEQQAAQAAFAALANNLAADLRYYWRAPDEAAAVLMLEAAHAAREAWGVAGGWLERERADWQVAMCAATVGKAELASAHAQACLQACETEGGDDYEFCFAWQAVAWAALAASDAMAARDARQAMAKRLAALNDPADSDYARSCLADIDTRLAG